MLRMIHKSSKQNSKLPSYEELHDAWWCVYNALEHISSEQVRDYLTRINFESLLEQCGWKIEEWNSALAIAKRRKIR